ncbi:biotin synthase-like enzyme [Bradyrhizobium yuanmingense]
MIAGAAVRTDVGGESPAVRTDWTRAEAEALYGLPFPDPMFQAQSLHRQHLDPSYIETVALLSIKTDGCPEGGGYSSQSVHYDAGVKPRRLRGRSG